MNKKTVNILCLLGADIIWGAAFVSQKIGGEVFGAFTFNFVRFLIGAVVLIPLILWRKKMAKKNELSTDIACTDNQNRIYKSPVAGGIMCGIALSVASNFQQIGLNEGATVGKAGFLTACYIVLVPILAIFIGKKIRILEILGVIIALAGLGFLCLNKGDFTIVKADALLIMCAVSFAVQILLIDHYAARTDGVKLSCVQFVTCGLVSGIPMVIYEMRDMTAWLWSFSSASGWLAILYAGVMSSGVAYTLQIRGQKNFNPAVASLIMSLESVFSVIFGALLLHEKMSLKEAIGSILIFVAVIVAQLGEFSKKAHAD